MICQYGCGKEAKYQVNRKGVTTDSTGKWCCEKHYNKCPAKREANRKGVLKAYNEERIQSRKDIYLSLPKETKDRMAWNRNKTTLSEDVIFCNPSSVSNSVVKNALINLNKKDYM